MRRRRGQGDLADLARVLMSGSRPSDQGRKEEVFMVKRIILAVLVVGGLGGSVLVYSGLTSQPAAACNHAHIT
jgi:hypothetical protein